MYNVVTFHSVHFIFYYPSILLCIAYFKKQYPLHAMNPSNDGVDDVGMQQVKLLNNNSHSSNASSRSCSKGGTVKALCQYRREVPRLTQTAASSVIAWLRIGAASSASFSSANVHGQKPSLRDRPKPPGLRVSKWWRIQDKSAVNVAAIHMPPSGIDSYVDRDSPISCDADSLPSDDNTAKASVIPLCQ